MQARRVLWRGIKGVKAPEEFLRKGGTELALMSSTCDLRVAARYARGVPDAMLFMLLGGHDHGAVPAGAPNARATMSLRYTQGAGRRGERQEQIGLSARLVAAVCESLQRAAVPWHALPRSLESWDVLL